MDSIATGGSPSPFLGDNGQPMPNFFVSPSPEPSTLALVGLGGRVIFVASRRRVVQRAVAKWKI